MNTTYHIDVLGRLWMPQCLAATSLTCTAGEGAFQHDVDDDTIEQWVFSHCGDFSAILDYRITKVEKTDSIRESDGLYTVTDTETTETVLRDWENEASEADFYDCMYPSDWEDVA